VLSTVRTNSHLDRKFFLLFSSVETQCVVIYSIFYLKPSNGLWRKRKKKPENKLLISAINNSLKNENLW